jgi:hypothetical protein
LFFLKLKKLKELSIDFCDRIFNSQISVSN